MSLGFACVLSEDALLYFWCEINSFVLWSCVVDLMFPITRKHKRIVIKLVENKTTKRERQTGGEGAFVCVQFAVHLNRHNSLWKSVWHEPCEFMLQSELAVCAFARFHFFFFFSINVGLVMSSSVKRKQKTVTQIPSETKATKKKIPQATQNPN